MHPHNDLYTIDPEYLDGIERVGGHTALVGFAADVASASALLARFDALLLSGGDDVDPAAYDATVDGSVGMNPLADASDAAYLAAALELNMPVLGVCRGIQLINVALGGTLLQHMWDTSDTHPGRLDGPDATINADEMLARRHDVQLEPGSLLAELFGSQTIEANSLHHQAIDRVADSLHITGRAPDGIVEAIEHRSKRLIAVQWHPERMPDGAHDVLFEWLVSEAASS